MPRHLAPVDLVIFLERLPERQRGFITSSFYKALPSSINKMIH